MDANDRNESAIRQRDAKLARRLGEALDQANPQSAGGCPDAEVIAAYSDRALGPDESAKCEDHFATCGRCRNILKVLAAGSDAPLAETEVAQLGQRVSAVRAPIEMAPKAAKPARGATPNWSTRWIGPAVGIAAALTVWFIMRPPWSALDRSGSKTLIAQAPQQEMPVSAPLAEDRAQKAVPAPETPAANNTAPNANPQQLANDQLKSRDAIRENSANESFVKSLPQEKKEHAPPASENKTKALGGSVRSPAAPPPPPSVESPQAAVSSAMNSVAPSPRPQAQADSSPLAGPAAPDPAATEASRSTGKAVSTMAAPRVVQGQNKPAAAPELQPPAADVPLNGRNFQALVRLGSAQRSPILLKSASGIPLWRVGAAGVIERTNDAGKIWVPQISPSKEDWLAGAAVSDTVGWLAGRNGAIARTTDGQNWQAVTPPSQATSSGGNRPDWTGIAAQDAQSATITATDGARFATSDGGKTWQRQ